jgi:cyclopropane-fatty-acyl-phospholipid synthase
MGGRAMLGWLLKQGIKKGDLTLIQGGRSQRFGDKTGTPVTIEVKDAWTSWSAFVNPWLKVGEAYMDGRLVIAQGTLYDFMNLAFANTDHLSNAWSQRWLSALNRLLRWWHQNNPVGIARTHVAHHYDLSRRLFTLFLDESMQYSCAYFANPAASLAEAQRAKMRHIAAKLAVKSGQRILDIGCGWGGLGLYLASLADVEIVGVTLSQEQLVVAQARAREQGLDRRVTFKLQDYRNETGQFDRIVSVGMFEHVGLKHYPEFFGKVDELLAPNGVALLHSIGRRDGPGYTNAWLRKYIFPGGYSPALSEVLPHIERTRLWVTDVEILRLHYAETLKAWRKNFENHRAEITEIYDERFCRMWEFYLIGSELSFRYDYNMVMQIQMAKGVNTLPITRDYMVDWERQHATTSARTTEAAE